jgi:hypothetical protein
MILHSYLLVPMGRKFKGLTKSPFLAIHAKGGESISPKAKGPHHHLSKNFNDIFQIGMLIFNWYNIFPIGIY